MTSQIAQPRHEIVVNDATHVVPGGCTVTALLEQLDMTGRRVAVARNGEVVPRSRFDQEALVAGDQIEILEAVGGG